LGWIAYAVLAYGLVTWILPVPLTLLHEPGHALPLLAFSRGRVIVRIGRQPARPVSISRLELRIRWLNNPHWGWFGFVEGEGEEPEPSRARRLAILASGPLVTAIVLVALVAAAAFVPWPASILIWIPALAVAWELLVTAVPMRYPRWFGPYAGRVSDGYRILRLFRAA
jgi:hypothetical protein